MTRATDRPRTSPGCRRSWRFAGLLAALAVALPSVASGQQVAPDTLVVPPDGVDAPVDPPQDTPQFPPQGDGGIVPPAPSVEPGVPGADTLEVQAPLLSDTLVLPDTLEVFVPRNFSLSNRHVPASWGTGTWEWDAEALRGTRALTLLELLDEIPGVESLLGGDHGQPAAVSTFGAGPGRIRVYMDGAELPPLDGGVVDLSRVTIAGLGSVRVQRRPGGLRVDLTPWVFEDPRPESFLEVGTGDLNTNVFRGVFSHPDALGGTVTAVLDRIDTGGRQNAEQGASFGAAIRHTLFPREDLAVAWEFRRMTSRRPEGIWEPADINRTEWGLRVGYELRPWLRLGLSGQRSSLEADIDEGSPPDTLVSDEPRLQVIASVDADGEVWWASGEYGRRSGPGWPSDRAAVEAGGALEEWGGVSVGLERESWSDGRGTSVAHARAWTRPVWGLSGFVELEDGSRGVPFWVPPPPPPTDEPPDEGAEEPGPADPGPVSVTNRTAVRGGVSFNRGDIFLGLAALSIEADSLHPMGLPTDRGGVVAPGGSRTGFEVDVQLPLGWLLDGLSLRGGAQFWDAAADWRYLPDRSYTARISFHDVFYESRNLEVWADVGVQGRDPMFVPVDASGEPTLTSVPFEQSWFARLQIRVASARLFIRWDNFTLRPDNQDYPDRLLPQTRAMYGIRWTLWD